MISKITLSFLLILYTLFLGGCVPSAANKPDPLDILFPYQRLDNIDANDFNEPSGLVFHPLRGTLFVIGDEGDIAEIQLDGSLVKERKIEKKDFEGIACDPATGLLYVVEESQARIFEINPEDFSVVREFSIEPVFGNKTILAEEKNKVEAITFVPDATHTEGGTFYLANKNLESHDAEESIIFDIEAPLKSSLNQNSTAKIISSFTLNVPDISDLYYNPNNDHLNIISDQTNTFFELTKEGQVLNSYALPGDNQEGFTVDNNGFLYLAQDSGGIIKFK